MRSPRTHWWQPVRDLSGPLLVPPVLLAGYLAGLAAWALLGIGLLGVATSWRLRQLVGQRATAQRALAASQAAARKNALWFDALVRNTGDVLTVVDAAGLVAYVSPSVERYLGYRPADLVGHPSNLARDPRDDVAYLALAMALQAEPHRDHRAEIRLLAADGTFRWFEVVGRNLLDDPDVEGIVINSRDVHDRHLAQERLHHDATHDPLTGLANRTELHRVLDDVLGEVLAEAPGSTSVAVLFVDLDGFKPVNDAHGHEYGDTLLIAVARLLERSVLGSDTVARVGGDEFVIVLREVGDEAGAIAAAERILGALRVPVTLPVGDVCVGASIGITVAGHATGASDLIRRADQAMYRAKQRGRNRWAVLRDDGDADDALTADELLARDLRLAIADDQLTMAYQPIVTLSDRTISGVESLVRWVHPTRGPVPPSDFIPVAERTGVIMELGRWILDRVCRETKGWSGLPGAEGLLIGVNLSARELDQPELAGSVLATLARTGFPADRLVLEVTESALFDAERAIPNLDALAAAGIWIAIDDFGTGYSSLQYLKQMPVQTLKLDKSFVDQLDGTSEGAAIADVVVRLSQTLRLDTVAEGIETEAQAEELRLLGYVNGQGYLFARPMPAADLEALLGRTLRPTGATVPA